MFDAVNVLKTVFQFLDFSEVSHREIKKKIFVVLGSMNAAIFAFKFARCVCGPCVVVVCYASVDVQ